MKELQELINNWKREADVLEAQMNGDVEAAMFAQLLGMARRLRFCIADAELLISQMENNDTQPQLHKHDVSGWQDFKDMQPNECEKVVLKDTDGYLLIAIHRAEYMDSMLRFGYSWCRLPA